MTCSGPDRCPIIRRKFVRKHFSRGTRCPFEDRARRRAFVPAFACALVAIGLCVGTPASAAGGGVGSGHQQRRRAEEPRLRRDHQADQVPGLAAPACVKPWKDGADNGGATAQGVTKDSIKVVVLYTNVVQDARSPASLYKNQATGGFSNQRDPIIDADAVYAHVFETWGRNGRVRVRARHRRRRDRAACRRGLGGGEEAVRGVRRRDPGRQPVHGRPDLRDRGAGTGCPARARHRRRAPAVAQGGVEGRRAQRGRVRRASRSSGRRPSTAATP